MKVYLDTCVWCRPFDYPSKRVASESAAFAGVLRKADRGDLEIVGSAALLAEIDFISLQEKREAVRALIRKSCSKILKIDGETVTLAEKIMEECRLSAMNAIHVATASKHADVFVTVDDEILKKSDCLKKFIEVKSVVDLEVQYGEPRSND